MPIPVPALDDRGYADLVEELQARIPAHTPEWTNVRKGDPGDAINRCAAWLIDTLLYRANLIPERQRLVFLQRLGIPLTPARAARGLVSLLPDKDATQAVVLAPLASIEGPVNFETRGEVTVLPVRLEVFSKRKLPDQEKQRLAGVVDALQHVYHVARAEPYVTSPVFPGGQADLAGFDLIKNTVDQSLWLGLFVTETDVEKVAAKVEAVRDTLSRAPSGGAQLLSIGVAPATEIPELSEEVSAQIRIPLTWEISFRRENGEADYLTLEALADSTKGFTHQGVVRLALPDRRFIGAPEDDPRAFLAAGVGNHPPRLDAPDKSAALVCWIRLRPAERLNTLKLSWIGVNAVEIDQRQTVFARVIGKSDGSPNQQFQLPGQSVDMDDFHLEIEEPGLGYRAWRRTDDLALEARDARAFVLDSEAGLVRLGDRVRGWSPDPGMQVRLAMGRFGGGEGGNLPPGSLTKISAKDVSGAVVQQTLTVEQMMPTSGGSRAETITEAELRIPSWIRNQNRAVTAEDYQRLAAETPGVKLGRVEVLPRFKPQQRMTDVPGVVSVMVLPFQPLTAPPYPRPDRPTIEAVHAYLDARRPIATELYVIGCRYVPLGLGVGVSIREGHGPEQTLNAVRESLRLFLWSLPPGGPDGHGWPLGRTVTDRELEVAVARVPGVKEVRGVRLFSRTGTTWKRIAPAPDGAVRLSLQPWELPELFELVVAEGERDLFADLLSVPNPFDDGAPGIPVPVIPDVCS
jgi:predicted phage baseplate assembly protein